MLFTRRRAPFLFGSSGFALGLAALVVTGCSDDDTATSTPDSGTLDASFDGGVADAAPLDGALTDATPLDGALGDGASDAADGATDGAIVDAGPIDGSVGTLGYALDKTNAEMRAVLDQLTALNGKPIETLTPAEARLQPTVADAVKALLTKQQKSTAPEAVASVADQTITVTPGGTASADGGTSDASVADAAADASDASADAGAPYTLPIRVYKPATASGTTLPVIVYYHGGGWVIATVDTYDASARALSNAVGAIVVSVEYRKGPESKFPAAHEDAYAAYRWVLQNAATLGGDPARVAVAGESAGGNMAATVSIRARDENVQLPRHELLVYPVASADLTTPSEIEFGAAKPLNKPMIVWFTDKYFNTPADGNDPRISLVNANLVGLPPTTIINAQVDPLRSDGDNLTAKLQAAKVDVVQQVYTGVTHEFFGTGAAVTDAKNAVGFAATRLKASLQ